MNRKGICFYQERATKDCLFVWRKPGHEQHLEGCANAISGVPSSVCWTAVGDSYLLARCRRVTRGEVAESPGTAVLLMRADWMAQQIDEHGIAVLPYPPS